MRRTMNRNNPLCAKRSGSTTGPAPLLALLAPCLLLAACGGHPEEEAAAKPVVPVKTALAEGSSVVLSLRAPATVFPREQANITPRITGVIRELKARKGDTVQAGALLATIENRDLIAQRDEAQAHVHLKRWCRATI